MTEPAPDWHPGPTTRAERDALPADGRRHELINGMLVVTPAPSWRHQRGVVRLLRLLPDLPSEFELLTSPVDVALADDTVVEPDLVVARKSSLGEHDVEGAPLLAVEVLSPSTRHLDRGAKKLLYAEAGCPSYWIVDPVQPSVVGYRLDGDEYVEFARAVGEELFEATEPFSVAFTPAELFR